MRTIGVAVVAVALTALAACSEEGTGSATSTSQATSTTTTTEGQSPSTTSEPTTTTTTPGSTTTAPEEPDDPYQPSASARADIPWESVGRGWYVVLYDSSKANPVSEEDARDGTEVLYLVNGSGDRYEVASWQGGGYSRLVDATSSFALVAKSGSSPDETEYERIDLKTGSTSVVYGVGYPESSYVNAWPQAALTRPTGTNTVVAKGDGTNEWIERRSADGTVLSVVFAQPAMDGSNSLRWLYAIDGTALVVAHHGGLTLMSNDGSPLHELWVPQDTFCNPVRWWDSDTFLASCFGQGPGSAPLDDQGQLHTFYGRLWLLENDGSAGIPLTEYPAEPPIIVDFGYHDAWPTSQEVYLQWYGDCGAAHVATLDPEGTGEFMDIDTPSELAAEGVEMIDITDGRITLYGWLGCDASVGELFTVDPTGRYVETLVPVIGDARGVVGVKGLATVNR